VCNDDGRVPAVSYRPGNTRRRRFERGSASRSEESSTETESSVARARILRKERKTNPWPGLGNDDIINRAITTAIAVPVTVVTALIYKGSVKQNALFNVAVLTSRYDRLTVVDNIAVLLIRLLGIDGIVYVRNML